MRFVQFRLRMLFMVTIIAAIGVSLWVKFVRPNVSEVNFNSYAMVIHFSDHWHQQRGLAYWDDKTDEAVFPKGQPTDVFQTEHFVLLPWSLLVTITILAVVGGGVNVLGFQLWRRWRTLSTTPRDA